MKSSYKQLVAISGICLSFSGLFFSTSAMALPFNKNCASLQHYFNKGIRWNNQTSFEGFQNSKMHSSRLSEGREYLVCYNGYATERSPQGTRVCKAILTYMTPSQQTKAFYNWGIRKYSSPERECVWR